MRILLLLVAYLAIALPAAARVTVAQLEHILTTARAEHKSDVEMVRQIGRVELSERLTEARLGRLTKNLRGPPTTQICDYSPISRHSSIRRQARCRPSPLRMPRPRSECSMLRGATSRKPCPVCPISSPPGPPVISTIALRNWGTNAWPLSAGIAPCEHVEP